LAVIQHVQPVTKYGGGKNADTFLLVHDLPLSRSVWLVGELR
jgi:hypothetical protein